MTVGVAAALASTLLAPPAQAGTVPTGPDVSRWQHPGGAPIDWVKVRGAGHSFAIVKATEGNYYTNPYFAGDSSGARAANLTVGAYAFVRPALPLSSAAGQAAYFVRAIGNTRSAGTLPPILDLEVSGGLSPADLITWTQQFLATVQTLSGRIPIIYTYPSFWSGQMAGSRAFSRYPLWLAAYRSTAPAPPAGWAAWSMWQYTSSGSVQGISGRVDLSRFNGSTAQLANLANGAVLTALTVTAPTAPVHIAATAGNSSATVRWQPSSDGGALLSGYTVTASPGGAVLRVAGSATAATMTRLVAGNSYRFTVVATNHAGSSARSATSNAVVPGRPPSTPGGSRATAGSSRVVVSWTAPTGAPTSYLVYRCSPAPCTPSGTARASVLASHRSLTDTTTANGTRYAYRVAGRNSFGTSAPGAVVSARPVGAPSAPATLTVTGAASSAALRWSPPRNGGGYAVTGYVVTVDGRAVATLGSAARAYTAAGLRRTVAHTFRVAARNALGNGAAASMTLAPVPLLLDAVLSATSTTVGHSVVLTGSTSVRFAGERIYRQGYYSGAWHNWTSTTVSSTGTYRFVITPTVAAVNIYRVLLPASRLHAIGASRSVALRVT